MDSPWLGLPLEIREMVYGYILASSTGHIIIQQKDSELVKTNHLSRHEFEYFDPRTRRGVEREPDLAMRCVSSQMNLEFTHFLYRTSKIFFPWAWMLNKINYTFPRVTHSFQHVVIEMCLWSARDSHLGVLQALSSWAATGHLKSVTIRAKERRFLVCVLDDLMDRWSDSKVDPANPAWSHFIAPYQETFSREPWTKINRRLELPISEKFRPSEWDLDPNLMMMDLHRTFGGELSTVGTLGQKLCSCCNLCYRDGEEIHKPFNWAPEVEIS